MNLELGVNFCRKSDYLFDFHQNRDWARKKREITGNPHFSEVHVCHFPFTKALYSMCLFSLTGRNPEDFSFMRNGEK